MVVDARNNDEVKSYARDLERDKNVDLVRIEENRDGGSWIYISGDANVSEKSDLSIEFVSNKMITSEYEEFDMRVLLKED
jgi:hypothetical protein